MPPVLIKKSRLKPLLRSRGKTQRWLADAIHVHYQRVNEWANDKYDLPVVIAKNIANVLDVTIDELYFWEEVSISEWKKWIESRRRKE